MHIIALGYPSFGAELGKLSWFFGGEGANRRGSDP